MALEEVMPTQKTQDRIVLGLSVLLALAFAGAGLSKLAGPAAAGEAFTHFGYPAWLALFIGTCETAGAVGLIVSRLRLLAALGLSIIMLGAIGSHLLNDPPANALPALVLLALLTSVIVLIRRRTAAGQEQAAPA